MNYRLPDNIGYFIIHMKFWGQHKMYYFKKLKKRKGKKKYVAQQRVYLTQKGSSLARHYCVNLHISEFRVSESILKSL